ncbi:MAG: sodium:calcium antiporter [Candidatus Woesearchaeota archaeon]
MLVQFLIVIAGVMIILLLSHIIIKNSISLAAHYGLSGTFIGLTLLSIGTSIPEIMTHIIGSIDILKDPYKLNILSGLVIGTNIGSDIFQQNFILGLLGLIATIVVIRKNLISQAGALIAASLLVFVFSLGGVITRIEGGILLLTYVAYLLYLNKSRAKENFKAKNNLSQKDVIFSIMLIVICFIVMAFTADEVLNASTILVSVLPISASFFGIILLGIASALPELMTSLVAMYNKRGEISAGILIGSNVTNPLFGIGIGALISSYTVPNVIIFFDLPVKIATACLIFYYLWRTEDINKPEGISLIVLFILYIIIRQWLFPVDF